MSLRHAVQLHLAQRALVTGATLGMIPSVTVDVDLPTRSNTFVSDSADLCNCADPIADLYRAVIGRERDGKTVGNLQGAHHMRPRPSSVRSPNNFPTW